MPPSAKSAGCDWPRRPHGTPRRSRCTPRISAYALLNLYKHTGSGEWLSHARRLANHAASVREEAQRPNSLWKGELGVAVLIADLESPENAQMPFFE